LETSDEVSFCAAPPTIELIHKRLLQVKRRMAMQALAGQNNLRLAMMGSSRRLKQDRFGGIGKSGKKKSKPKVGRRAKVERHILKSRTENKCEEIWTNGSPDAPATTLPQQDEAVVLSFVTVP